MFESLNWINFFIATLGLTASVYLFFAGKENPYLSKLLSIIIFALSIRNFSQSLLNLQILDFSVYPGYLFVGFQFIVPASIFLYQRALVSDELKWDNKHLWHFMPGIMVFIIVFLSFITYKQNPVNSQSHFIYDESVQELKMFVEVKVLYVLWLILALPYLVLIYKQFLKAISLGSFLGKHGREIGVWVLIQLIPFTVFYVLLGKEVITAIFNQHAIITNTHHLIIKNIYLLIMVIYIWMKPQLLLGLPNWKTNRKNNSSNFPIELEISGWKNPKFEDTQYSHNKNLTTLMLNVQNYACSNTIFLSDDYSLEDLSNSTKIPLHHLKFLFRYYQEHGFIGYKNFIRMVKVIQFIIQNKHLSQTIESLGTEAGFGSNSTMLRSFKKYLGQSPMEIIHLIQTAEVTHQTNNSKLNSICKLIPTA